MNENTSQTEGNNSPVVEQEEQNNVVIETAGDDKVLLELQNNEQESIEEYPSAEDTPQKEDAQETEKPRRKNRAQRRIDRLVSENKKLEAKLKEKEAAGQKAESSLEEINADDFDDYDDYVAALEDRAKANQANLKEPETQVTPDETGSDLDASIFELIEDGKEDYEDFEELVHAEDLALTEQILEIVLDTESPSDVTYYLATNKKRTAEIARMSERDQIKEILKIEIELDNKPVKKVKPSAAPEPISPVSGSSTEVKTPATAGSYSEYEAIRTKESSHNGW